MQRIAQLVSSRWARLFPRLGLVLHGSLLGGALALALPAQTPLTTELVVSGLDRPVFLTAPAGDTERLFILEQRGKVRIVKNGTLLPTPFVDLTPKITCCGEHGLLGLAFHPDHASNGQVFVSYVTPDPTYPQIATIIARLTVSPTDPDLLDPTSEVQVLKVSQPYTNHNGGMIAFGPLGYLYLGLGDGGNPNGPPFVRDPLNNAQNPAQLLGKMLRLDVDGGTPYAIPASNPFVGDPTTLDEIWALGMRNPWRFSFDALTGDLYIADVGGFMEELDFEPAGFSGGRNYGWKCTAGTWCTGEPVCICNGPTLTPPVYEYDPPSSCQSIIGGYVYRGTAIPDLQGAYVFGDFCSSPANLWSLRVDSGGSVAELTDRTAELAPGGALSISSISSFGQDGNGELYVLDLAGGEVFRIAPRPAIAGLDVYGAGTAGCDGRHTTYGNGVPALNNASFAVTTNRAPASSVGVMFFGALPDPAGLNLSGSGLILHVDFASVVLSFPASSDASGNSSFPLPIPGDAALLGGALHAQTVWGWAGPCQPSLWSLSSSNGLTVTIQP